MLSVNGNLGCYLVFVASSPGPTQRCSLSQGLAGGPDHYHSLIKKLRNNKHVFNSGFCFACDQYFLL